MNAETKSLSYSTSERMGKSFKHVKSENSKSQLQAKELSMKHPYKNDNFVCNKKTSLDIVSGSTKDAKSSNILTEKIKKSKTHFNEPELFEDIESHDVKFYNVKTEKGLKLENHQHCTINSMDILKSCQEIDGKQIFEIDLHGQELHVIPDLKSFKGLKILDLSGNLLTAITGLQHTKELKDLKLYDNKIEKINGLNGVTELCSLQLQYNKISQIGQGLLPLKNLQILRLDSNRMKQIEKKELISCVNLTTLDLSNNQLDSLTVVSCLPNLQELLASGNLLKNVGNLSNCKRLQELDLSRNNLTDLNGIANLPNLQILDVSFNQLTTLKGVQKLRSLEELNINNNKIKELQYFAVVFPKLQLLNASHNLIQSLNEVHSLSGVSSLCELNISFNPICPNEGDTSECHQIIWKTLQNLEILDGISRKISVGKVESLPIMSPMSATSVVTLSQLDSQLQSVSLEEESLYKDFENRLKSLQTNIHNLDNYEITLNLAMLSKTDVISKPKASSHSVENLVCDITQSDEETKSTPVERPNSSKCSSRFRIKEARVFAARTFDDSDDDIDE